MANESLEPNDPFLDSTFGEVLVGEGLDVECNYLNYSCDIPVSINVLKAKGDLISSCGCVLDFGIPQPVALPVGESGQHLSVAQSNTPTGLAWDYFPTIGAAVSRYNFNTKGSVLIGNGCSAGCPPLYASTAISLPNGSDGEILTALTSAPYSACWRKNPFLPLPFTAPGQLISSDSDSNVALVTSGGVGDILVYNDSCEAGWGTATGKSLFVPQRIERGALIVGCGIDESTCSYPITPGDTEYRPVANSNCALGIEWAPTPDPMGQTYFFYCFWTFAYDCLTVCFPLIPGSDFPQGSKVYASITFSGCFEGTVNPRLNPPETGCIYLCQGNFRTMPLNFWFKGVNYCEQSTLAGIIPSWEDGCDLCFVWNDDQNEIVNRVKWSIQSTAFALET